MTIVSLYKNQKPVITDIQNWIQDECQKNNWDVSKELNRFLYYCAQENDINLFSILFNQINDIPNKRWDPLLDCVVQNNSIDIWNFLEQNKIISLNKKNLTKIIKKNSQIFNDWVITKIKKNILLEERVLGLSCQYDNIDIFRCFPNNKKYINYAQKMCSINCIDYLIQDETKFPSLNSITIYLFNCLNFSLLQKDVKKINHIYNYLYALHQKNFSNISLESEKTINVVETEKDINDLEFHNRMANLLYNIKVGQNETEKTMIQNNLKYLIFLFHLDDFTKISNFFYEKKTKMIKYADKKEFIDEFFSLYQEKMLFSHIKHIEKNSSINKKKI